MRTSTRSILVGGLAAAMVFPASVDAQRNRQGRGPDRAELEQRIRAQMGRMMQERLGLDEAQATQLSEVVQDFEGQRRELARLEQATRRRVEALILEGNGDEQEARGLLQRMAELRVQEAELFGAELIALLTVLSPAQVLELQSLREDLGRRIRRLRGDSRGNGGRNGGRRR